MARHYVNLWQTAEERREKYWLVRSLGLSSSWAAAIRDWPLSKIERRFHFLFDRETKNGKRITAHAQLCLPGFPLIYRQAVDSLNLDP